MNKNTAVVGGIITLAVIGGLIFYIINRTPATTPPPGTTPPPPASNGTQVPGKPVATTNITTALTDTTAVVTGSANPYGAPTSYWYEYGVSAEGLGSKTSSQAIGSGYVTISTPAYITGLTKNTTYFFRLVAENQFGRSMGTEYSFQTPSGNPPPPVGSVPEPKTVAASGITRTAANLNGKVTANKAATQYWFEYGKTPNLGNTTAFASVADTGVNVSASMSLVDLSPATTYYFRLNAQNQFGTVNGDTLNFKTLAPPATPAPSVDTNSATGITAGAATLHGAVDPNGTETKYWFEYNTDSLLDSALLRSTSKVSAGAGTARVSVKASISGLAASTTYYFRIVAENSTGIVRGERMEFKTNKN